MRVELLTVWALLGLAAAHAIERRDPPACDHGCDDHEGGHDGGHESDHDGGHDGGHGGGHDDGHDDGHGGMDGHKPWRPKTHEPHFFNLYVNDKCHRPEDSDYDINSDPPADVYADPIALANMKKNYCPLEGYAIRLEHGNVIATPYNKWWDPKLPTFFVDDDTQCYTVSWLHGPRGSMANWLCRSAKNHSSCTSTLALVP